MFVLRVVVRAGGRIGLEIAYESPAFTQVTRSRDDSSSAI